MIADVTGYKEALATAINLDPDLMPHDVLPKSVSTTTTTPAPIPIE